MELFKVSGTTHIDIAAHLKLLGESLAVIGARLQEHRVKFWFFCSLNWFLIFSIINNVNI